MNEVIEKDIKIEDMIYEIRGKQVMIDSDLAKLYGVETKYLNRQVKRNIERFDNDFMFQLAESEYSNLKCQIVTSSLHNYGGRRTLPYVFTEFGVTALAGILRSDIAIDMSKKIVRAFVSMRHYIGNNEYRLSNVETKLLEHDNKINLLTESFNKLDENKKETDIYFHGKMFDAYYKIYKIFNEAKNELIIADNYADPTLLDIIKRLNVKVIIITKKDNLLTKRDIDKYNLQYHNLTIIYSNKFHDRYFILDKEIMYHCGTSINRIGYKTFSITLMGDKFACNNLLDYVTKIINKQY